MKLNIWDLLDCQPASATTEDKHAMDTLRTYNGNNQLMQKELPKLSIIGFMNETALDLIYKNTGLSFQTGNWGNLEAQPTKAEQIATLLVTYNFKTQYHDNATDKNTLCLKYCSKESFIE